MRFQTNFKITFCPNFKKFTTNQAHFLRIRTCTYTLYCSVQHHCSTQCMYAQYATVYVGQS